MLFGWVLTLMLVLFVVYRPEADAPLAPDRGAAPLACAAHAERAATTGGASGAGLMRRTLCGAARVFR